MESPDIQQEISDCKQKFDSHAGEIRNVLLSIDKLYQTKQKNLLTIEEKIKQAEEELIAKQAAVAMVSPEVPRDIRTEIFSHLQPRKQDTRIYLVGGIEYARFGNTTKFVLFLISYGKIEITIPLLAAPEDIDFQNKLIQEIHCWNNSTIKSQIFDVPMAIENEIRWHVRDKLKGSCSVTFDRTFVDVRKALSTVIENIDQCMGKLEQQTITITSSEKKSIPIKELTGPISSIKLYLEVEI